MYPRSGGLAVVLLCAAACTTDPGGIDSGLLPVRRDGGTVAAGDAGPGAVALDGDPAFGPVPVGDTSSHRFWVRNVGTVRAAVASASVDGSFSVDARACNAPIDPAAHCTLTVSFAPTAGGPTSATLEVVTSAGLLAVTLVGTGLAPQLQLSPSPVDFGVFPRASGTRTQAVLLANRGAVATSGVPSVMLRGSPAFSIGSSTCTQPLAPDATCTVSIAFAPISNVLAESELQATVAGSTARTPIVGRAQDRFEFQFEGDPDLGAVVVGGASGGRALVLRNTGTQTINGADLSVAGSEFQITPCDEGPIAPGDGCSFQVTFAPSAAGSRSAPLQATGLGGLPIAHMLLQGTGVGRAALAMAPASLDLGQGSFEQPTTGHLTVTNTGGVALSGPVTVTRTGDSAFVPSSNCGAMLAPGASCTVTVLFAPTPPGPRLGAVEVSGPDTNTARSTLSGLGVGPAALAFSPPVAVFGQQPVGATAEQTLTLRNATQGAATGALSAAVASGSDSDQFELASSECSAGLAPGASCALTVRFKPLRGGEAAAFIQVQSGQGAVALARLEGAGLGPARLVAAATRVDFPPTAVGDPSAPRSIAVSNLGELASGALTTAVVGPDFEATACRGPLPPGGSCLVWVTFTPTALGARQGNLTISSPGASAASPTLTGTGKARGARLRSDEPSIDLGQLESGVASAPLEWVLRNTGDAPTGPIALASVPSNVSLVSDTCSGVALAVGASCRVRFTVVPGLSRQALELTAQAAPGGTAGFAVTVFGMVRLTVRVLGPGVGAIENVGPGARLPRCTSVSTALFPPFTQTRLRARTANGPVINFHAGWNNCDEAQPAEDQCLVNLNGPTVVEARFEVAEGMAFITSERFGGSGSEGLAFFDRQCNAAASAAGINSATSDGYVALLASSSGPAVSRLPGAGTILRRDGAIWVLSGADLALGRVRVVLDLDEHGTEARDGSLSGSWTGALRSGALAPRSCGDWFGDNTTNDGMYGVTGEVTGGPGSWLQSEEVTCGNPFHVLCARSTGTAVRTVPPPPPGSKLAYYTSTPFLPGPGKTPDAHCDAHRPPGTSGRVFKALVARSTPTRGLFDLTARYYRPDGTFIGTGNDIVSARILSPVPDKFEGFWVDENGNTSTDDLHVWLGAPHPLDDLATEEDTCNSWQSNASSLVARLGRVNTIDWQWTAFPYDPAACDSTANRLICFEP